MAQLAGLPRAVIVRAWEVLGELEGDRRHGKLTRADRSRKGTVLQMPLFGEPSPVEEELLGLDVSYMTPLEAINALYQLQQKARASAGERHGAAE